MKEEQIRELQTIACKIRQDAVNAIHCAGSGHPGGSMSIAEILAVLYFHSMNIDPLDPRRPDRDRLVLSKGHAAPAYYAALARRGYFQLCEMDNLRKLGCILQGHPDMRKVPGVDMSTGSLGQGLSAANGMAIVGKREQKTYRVYAVLGDGETQEGQIWEAVMSAAHYKLDNLTVFLDNNGLQIDGKTEDVMKNESFTERFSSFGWAVHEIDGHDVSRIIEAIEWARSIQGKPSIIVCNTIKGKGISYMQNQAGWHGACPDKQQQEIAVQELQQAILDLEVK